MGRRYQDGYLRLSKHKAGPGRWEYLWREVNPLGTIVRRKAIVGTAEQYPTASAASEAINGLRVSINEDRNRQRGQNITVADLVDHYKRIELANDSVWHAYATRIAYQEFIERYIRPRWGTYNIRQVRTVDVEMWLRQLLRVNGVPLANSTKAKIRSLMSVLFNHAIRYEWLEQGKNPITLVRQSAKRMRVPDVLEVEEISALIAQLDSPFRLMVLFAATTGLRRSELFALKWRDVDFSNLEIQVTRSIFRQVIGDCKTEGSRRPVPIDASLAADLWIWREATHYRGPDDWIFASCHTYGLHPFWPDIVLAKVIRPAAKRAGIEKRIGWHTFRHSFSTLLVGNGENVKVIQELMRHASARFTMDIYSQAKAIEKRTAHQRIVAMIRPEEVQGSSIPTIQASA
jgi:integrase